MRYSTPRVLETDEAGSLISISDMMAGLLFVFIITLAAFIIRFQQAVDVQTQIKEELTGTQKQRARLLQELQQKLKERGIVVQVDTNHGVLRLMESAIQFEVGRANLAEMELGNLQVVGEVMASVLPCYTDDANRDLFMVACDEQIFAKLDSILIEGHTDNIPILNEQFKSNWELSTQRAIETYRVLQDSQAEMMDLHNPSGQLIFSVSGYGDGRPLNEHAAPTPDAENRRIDFRFIMTPPRVVEPQRQISESVR